MGFVIKKIVVHSEPTRVRGGEAHYNMVREKWDVRNLLEVLKNALFLTSIFRELLTISIFLFRCFHVNIVIKIFA